MRRCRPGLAVLAASALVAASCRSAPPRPLGFEDGAPAGPRVAVAPLNLPVELAPDLEDAVDPVGLEIVRHLRSRGARVAVIFAADAWTLWRRSAAAVQAAGAGAPDPVGVGRAFALSLAEHADYDLLVLPSLVFRDARVMGHFAHWDGVRRRIRFRGRSGAPPAGARPIPDPIAGDAAAPPPESEWRGRITGLSVHALAFTPEGRSVFQGFGGLDLVHDAVLEREGSGDAPSLRLQPALLENGEHLRQGVARVLDPCLGEGRSASGAR
jgi:hypothetical protein